MKTAISLPDDVFEAGERLARREGRSRSDVYSAALREYVARHSADEVTEALDKALTSVSAEPDAFVRRAGSDVLERSEW